MKTESTTESDKALKAAEDWAKHNCPNASLIERTYLINAFISGAIYQSEETTKQLRR